MADIRPRLRRIESYPGSVIAYWCICSDVVLPEIACYRRLLVTSPNAVVMGRVAFTPLFRQSRYPSPYHGFRLRNTVTITFLSKGWVTTPGSGPGFVCYNTPMKDWKLTQTHHLSSLGVDADIYKHKSGATLVHTDKDSENLSFFVVFHTPVDNDTGVPHIIEHSVLAESQKYKSHDLFASMMSNSMAYFINAMTDISHTMYPFATSSEGDFFNLLDIYLDVVFRPVLSEKTFKQEGWRYTLDDDEQIGFSGVVFNEMKGALGSPSNFCDYAIMPYLFPASHIGHNAGGDPLYIPDLTYEQFKEFYQQHYNPSTAIFILTGRLPMQTVFDRLLPYFKDAQKPTDSPLPPIKRFAKPKSLRLPYPAVDDDYSYTYHKHILTDKISYKDSLALLLMAELLLNKKVGRLHKKLIDTGKVKNIRSTDYHEYQVDNTLWLSFGVKGIHKEDVGDVRRIIDEEIEVITQNPDTKVLESLLAGYELKLKPRQPQSWAGSRSISSFIQMHRLTMLIAGYDLWENLDSASIIEELRADIYDNDAQYFKDIATAQFVHNPHKLDVVFEPDASLGRKKEAEIQKKLDDRLSNLDTNQMQKLKQEIREFDELLRQDQEGGDQHAKNIPQLKLSELPASLSTVDSEITTVDDIDIRRNKINQSDVCSLDIAIDSTLLDLDEVAYLWIYTDLLSNTGCGKISREKFASQMGLISSGIQVKWFLSYHRKNPDQLVLRTVLHTDFLVDRAEEVMHRLSEFLVEANLSDKSHIRSRMTDLHKSLVDNITDDGHSYVIDRARAGVQEWYGMLEYIEGISFIERLDKLLKDDNTDKVSVILKNIHSKHTKSAGTLFNLTGGGKVLERVTPLVSKYFGQFSRGDRKPTLKLDESLIAGKEYTREVEGAVNFVGMGVAMPETDINRAVYGVASRIVSRKYLWQTVRQKGGAYGSSMAMNKVLDTAGFYSYRDPHIKQTLDAFVGAGEFLENLKLDRKTFNGFIIRTIGWMEVYGRPAQKGFDQMYRGLTGEDEEYRQETLDMAKSVTQEDVRRLGTALRSGVERKDNVATAILKGKAS